MAVVKMLAALLALIALGSRAPALYFAVYTPTVGVFGAAGLWLYLNAKGTRASFLGITYLLVGSAFCEPMLMAAATARADLEGVMRFLLTLAPEAFIPFTFAMFALARPRSLGRAGGTWTDTWLRVSTFAVGVVLSIPMAHGLVLGARDVPALVAALAEPDAGENTYFWDLVMVSTLLAGFAMLRWSRTGTDRRRFHLFGLAVVLGVAPFALSILAMSVSSRFEALMREPQYRAAMGFFVYGGLWSIPFITAYAVIAHKVLEVHLVVRQAIRYAFARYTIIAASALPLVLLAAYMYRRRDEALVEIIGDAEPVTLAAVAVAGLAIGRTRQLALRAIDRRFFRDQYDGTVKLAGVLDTVNGSSFTHEMLPSVEQRLADALTAGHAYVLARTEEQDEFRGGTPEVRALASSSALVRLAEGASRGVDCDPEEEGGVFEQLPVEDQEWLVDTSVRLLVAIRDAGSWEAAGLLGITEKRNELPFTEEEKAVLTALASALAVSAGRQFEPAGPDGRSRPGTTRLQGCAEARPARCCGLCGQASSTQEDRCARCGGVMVAMAIPLSLLGKLKILRRLGSGGMGVVYLGRDLHLDRLVAVKTLPRLAPGHVLRLRREARAVAAVTHEYLAEIYAEESWHGVPLLIFEYMAGGTLADLLAAGPLAMDHTLRLGTALCSALERVHAKKITHRDIKPSNVGLTSDGVPKLMDFGLATVAADRHDLPVAVVEENATTLTGWVAGELVVHMAGTPGYLSPEVLSGDRPDEQVDLWALAVTLHQCLTGTLPGESRRIGKMWGCVLTEADVQRLERDYPASVCSFFRRALAADTRRRFPGARAMRDELGRCLQQLDIHTGDQVTLPVVLRN